MPRRAGHMADEQMMTPLRTLYLTIALLALLAPAHAQMPQFGRGYVASTNPFALIASTSQVGAPSTGLNSVTTGTPLNTTSCTPDCLIVVAVAYSHVGAFLVLTDTHTGCASPCNTWTLVNSSVSGDAASGLYDCFNCSVGASHTFTFAEGTGNCYCAIAVEAWTGAGTGLDPGITNMNTSSSSTTIQPGLVTPLGNNELVISTDALGGALSSVSGPFTLDQNVAGIGAQSYGIGLAYLKQTTAGAANPTFTATAPNSMAAQSAAFK